ncbi:MAG: NUDIX hydrolase [Peptococcaceae bacterium]|nr:NUDIX hydrolase [Peptococcaceae bacterium]
MKLSKEDLDFAAAYDASPYWHPSVTADTAVFRALDDPANAGKKYPVRKLELLLIKRGNHPYKGGWALPGGFLNKDESLLACAKRECREETGLAPVYAGEIGTYSAVDRDPRTRVISQCFLAVVPYGETGDAQVADDASEAAWFEVKMTTVALATDHYRAQLTLTNGETVISGSIDLKSDGKGGWTRSIHEDAEALAFDHLEIICCAVEALRTKMYRTAIAFRWVPAQFRLADLQGVFEAVIGQELLRTTFFEHLKPLLKRADVPENDGKSILDQVYEYNSAYCLEDGMSALDMWQS